MHIFIFSSQIHNFILLNLHRATIKLQFNYTGGWNPRLLILMPFGLFVIINVQLN